MADREKVIRELKAARLFFEMGSNRADGVVGNLGCKSGMKYIDDAIALLKEQEKKRITFHKKHGITWRRNEKFSVRELYEAICEILLDEGELFIERTDRHEKVDFVFYVVNGGEVE